MKLKKLLFPVILQLISIFSFAQEKYEPTILILSPAETRYEKSFNKEVSELNSSLDQNANSSETEAYLNSEEFLSQPENFQQMMKSEFEYSKNLDIFKKAGFISEQYLAYRFFEKFPNLLILLKDQKSDGALSNLKSIAESNNVQYILNFLKIELYKKDKIGYAKIDVQLYDMQSNTVVLNQSYTGDWNNPGFEFSCNNGSINCTINNALSQALDEVIRTIAIASPTLRKQRLLAQERLEVLRNEYLQKIIDEDFLENIPEKKIEPFQLLLNEDKTKFVAFYLQQVSPQEFQDLTRGKKDKNVRIITPHDIKDENFLKEIPQTYAYVIKGVKYEDSWYTAKAFVTYFQANSVDVGEEEYFNNLQQWNFFRENSTEFNPEFWETELFEKVTDLTKEPDWDEYGEEMWLADEINNRDYVGLYVIVADSLREERKGKNEIFENRINEEVFQKAYQKLKEDQPNVFTNMSEHSLIFSKNRELALNPVLVTNAEGVRRIHYFVAFDGLNELYEWVYFDPLKVEDTMFGSEVVEQIGSLTPWNFSVDNLNDKNFWDHYVLAKQGIDYKYLRKIKE